MTSRSLTPWGGLAAALALSLSGCAENGAPAETLDTETSLEAAAAPLLSSPEATRFLGQATFGPTVASINRVRNLGYGAWMKEQMAARQTSHLAYVNTVAPPTNEQAPQPASGFSPVQHTFWTAAARGPDQLRQRVAYALSQIFVISGNHNGVVRRPAGAASYMDMLARNAFGNYRNLLQQVSLHPMMGLYLSHLGNRKADTATGRAPDENYAREVMQLFSIGLYELNLDGSQKLVGGKPVETYGDADIAGLARVFTGWSWACADGANATQCFNGAAAATLPDRDVRFMQANPAFHSPEEKAFLDITIPAGTAIGPSLKQALDRLYNHPNVGPFLGKQLIQRLVTSNPSKAYVARVAQAFNSGTFTFAPAGIAPTTFGDGVRGNLAATVAAVLLDAEARGAAGSTAKLQEPVLRLSNWLRAFNAMPEAAAPDDVFRIGSTSNRSTQLGQSPMLSPSVFNFYRPGYIPPGTTMASQKLVAPEFQITDEVSAAGYSNFMQNVVATGILMPKVDTNGDGTPDTAFRILPNYTAELALATNPTALVNRLDTLVGMGRMTDATKSTIVSAINTLPIPVSPPAAVDAAKLRRVRLAVFMSLLSADAQVQ